MNIRSVKIVLLLSFFIVLFSTNNATSECKASFVNLINDVKWDGIFPIEIAGVEIKGPSNLPNPDHLKRVVCYCRRQGSLTFGLTFSFWEPARVIETVKDAWCFPLLGGLKINPGKDIGGGGSQTHTAKGTSNSGSIFRQAHWYFFSVFNILDLFMDVPCIQWDGFDIAYVTELDILWQRDDVAMFIHPEVLLFANPVAQMSCIADSVAATVGYPIDPLFWCVGSWGSVYPMTGKTSVSNIVEGNAALAAKMIAKLGRELLLWDTALDLCGPVVNPIWVKSHYKVHLMKPVVGSIIQLGQSGIIWGVAKNPPYGSNRNAPDNFDFMLFRRIKCCLGPSLGGK
ncbi:MAG: TraU family protein [Candidatus Micrarchaeia archaeon]